MPMTPTQKTQEVSKMGNIIQFPVPHRKRGLERLVDEIVRQDYAAMGLDSLAATRQAEQLYVAGSYVHSYLKHVGFSPDIAEFADLACLNPYLVAEHVAPDLGPDEQAGIARTVAFLVAHARNSSDEPVAA
jgi:hypothetical protein